MKKFNLIGVIVLSAFFCTAQNDIKQVVEYNPAPGQHINIESVGTPQAAENMITTESKLVSLGSFGGYIVLKFSEPCENDPENPYGIDFTIFGNAFGGSSEPGVVWVMKDENQNGLPDDTWFEIAGSHHYLTGTKRNFEITYFKTETREVGWRDEYGNTGFVNANSFNTQEYYPLESYFPQYPKESVNFIGTKISVVVNRTNPMVIKIKPLDFGYADNHPKKQSVNLTIPDNPYTEEVEGSGGDPFDISWAVDNSGNYVDLDEIHFVKIVSGNLVDLGSLGEASTDISYVVDVEPNISLTGKKSTLVIYQPPAKIIVGDTILLDANYFNNGKITEAEISFATSDSEILEITRDGNLLAKNVGEVEISVSAVEESKNVIIKVVQPDSILMMSDFSAVYPGDSILLEAMVFDNAGESLNLVPVFTNQNSAVGKIISVDNKNYFVAQTPGEIKITCSLENFQLEKTFLSKVFSAFDKIKIYFTLKTEEENLLPLQWIEVGLKNINDFVEDRHMDYSGINRLTSAHAIIAGLQKTQLTFVFKDNGDSAGELYLFSVENDGLFTYGWGGKTDPLPFAKAWIAKLNGKHYLNKFDKYPVANGDTIILYHVSDITNQWQFSRLLVSEDSVKKGNTVEILFDETTCSFQNDTITEGAFVPLGNQKIVVDQSYFTDEDGKVVISLDSDPPWTVSAGNNSVLVTEKLTTNISRNYLHDIQIYPNPVNADLNISGKNLRGSIIRIFNINGQLLYDKKAMSDFETLNLFSLSTGFYQLTVIQNNSTGNFKFLKK